MEVDPMKKRITWIVVADGARARVLMNEGVGKGLQPAINGDLAHALPRSRDLGTDRPGRVQQRGTSGRHAIAPHVDWHRFEKEKFGKEIARLLDDAAERNAFDRLVLIAPPRTLGDLRAALAPRTRGFIFAELDKDLTHATLQELPDHLADVVAL
ncbi:MAG TPA: host attachment protein [Methylomirabilota bacterium]|nr:host attachment protein [Methylomirabilota bacterium]